jgi:hypothetical protein
LMIGQWLFSYRWEAWVVSGGQTEPLFDYTGREKTL